MKFCKDCKHIFADDGLLEYAKCMRCPTESEVNPVTGEPEPVRYRHCDMARILGPCGPDAKFWEPR